ncbi:Lrp/AsnC ligand binding domain-containing protein, partial [Shigella sp. FC1967]|uniref:Lrp/AsnC ligand binding domain-containing protein n=1 Tax=Shigella sp. FC1967 TaxID=1898041 RepID=UPI001C0A6A4B
YDYMLQLVVKDMEDFHNVSMMKIRAIGNIKEMNISGRYDYMLQLVVKDMEDFHNVSMMKIRAIGNIKEM